MKNVIDSKLPRIGWVPTQLGGVILYRCENFLKYLKRRNFAVSHSNYKMDEMMGNNQWEDVINDPKFRIIPTMQKLAENCDILVFQKFKSAWSVALQRALKHKFPNIAIVTEVDDYALNVPQWNQANPYYAPGRELFQICQDQLAFSDAVIVSTNRLKEYYRQYNKNIYVVENSIDFEWWGAIKNDNKKNKKVRIGWAASMAHQADLDFIMPALKEIIGKYGERVEVMFFGSNHGLPVSAKDSGIKFDFKVVDIYKYPEAMKSKGFDICIAPLRDHEFNRAKSANRFLEYSMLKVPTVLSDIGGQYNEVVKHGENGFLAATPSEWVKSLSKLIDDKDLRINMGKKAFETVKKYHNAETNVDKLIDVLKKIDEAKYGLINNRKPSANTATADTR